MISVDRTLMSTHHDREFVGFMTTGPPVLFPEKIWMWVSAPKVKVDGEGRPRFASYGLRKIEVALQNAGFKAAVIDPDSLGPYLKRARALLIGHHDYFAFNPPSSEWWLVTGKEPVNRRRLLEFMSRTAEVKRRWNPDMKTVVGGPSAWQWLYTPHYLDQFLVDTIVEGEAEKLAVRLAEAILDGEPLPRYISVAPRDSPRIDEIPAIKAASVNGLVEIMRGCPRGCKFCNVTLRPLRMIPLNMIEEELRVNTDAGIESGVIHSEDVLLYGADGVHPRPEPLIKLHRLVKRYYKAMAWSHASLAAVVAAQREHKLITKLSEMILGEDQDFTGFQTGIETGSPRLARAVMPAKAAPYPSERWPEVVEEAFVILHEHRIVPAATLIIGLPGETPDDVVKTIELVERLKPYRSMVVPMFFVPMGVLRREDWFRSVNLTRDHAELMLVTLRHSVYWAKDIISTFYLRGAKLTPVRLLLSYFLGKAAKFAEGLTPDQILDHIEETKERLATSKAKEEPVIRPLAKLKAVLTHS